MATNMGKCITSRLYPETCLKRMYLKLYPGAVEACDGVLMCIVCLTLEAVLIDMSYFGLH